MASTKNTARSKRKYGEARKAKTEANRQRKHDRAELRTAALVERTRKLIGQRVQVRVPEPLVGTVLEMTSAPDGAKRSNGSYLTVATRDKNHVKSRHRVRPVR